MAPVVEQGGGLERTKPGHYAAATKPVCLRGVVGLPQRLRIVESPRAFVFLTRTGVLRASCGL